MTDLDAIDTVRPTTGGPHEPSPFEVLREELVSALSLYWSTASHILDGSGIRLRDPGPDFFLWRITSSPLSFFIPIAGPASPSRGAFSMLP